MISPSRMIHIFIIQCVSFILIHFCPIFPQKPASSLHRKLLMAAEPYAAAWSWMRGRMNWRLVCQPTFTMHVGLGLSTSMGFQTSNPCCLLYRLVLFRMNPPETSKFANRLVIICTSLKLLQKSGFNVTWKIGQPTWFVNTTRHLVVVMNRTFYILRRDAGYLGALFDVVFPCWYIFLLYTSWLLNMLYQQGGQYMCVCVLFADIWVIRNWHSMNKIFILVENGS